MGASLYPEVTPKTRFALTLTSGTSWTVPSGVTYVNVVLYGGGGGGRTRGDGTNRGYPGQAIASTLATTPGASITYAIGAGGSTSGGNGGTTTFTGATSAVGGSGVANSDAATGTSSPGAENGGANIPLGSGFIPGAGGTGSILVEYWV